MTVQKSIWRFLTTPRPVMTPCHRDCWCAGCAILKREEVEP